MVGKIYLDFDFRSVIFLAPVQENYRENFCPGKNLLDGPFRPSGSWSLELRAGLAQIHF